MGTSLVTDVENAITSAEAEVKSWWGDAETATRNLAAIVYSDLKTGFAAGVSALENIGGAELKTITGWLQDEAAVVIGLAEQSFGSALSGNVKFSVALSSLWSSIQSKAIPGLEGVGAAALKNLFSMSTLTTVLQAAFGAMLAAGAI